MSGRGFRREIYGENVLEKKISVGGGEFLRGVVSK